MPLLDWLKRLATVAALERVLKADGLTFHDLADHIVASPQVVFGRAPEPDLSPPRDENWRIAIEKLLDYAPLSEWEYGFCTSIRSQQRWRLSEKQQAVLLRLKRKYLDGVAA